MQKVDIRNVLLWHFLRFSTPFEVLALESGIPTYTKREEEREGGSERRAADLVNVI